MRLDWQRKAVVFFASSLFILSVVLVFFALREAGREKLLKEREFERDREQQAEIVANRSDALIREAENRVLRALRKDLLDRNLVRLSSAANDIVNDEPLVSDVFFIDSEDQVDFLTTRPLYLLPGEKRQPRDVIPETKADERWQEAEDAEFRLKDYARAISLYRGIAVNTGDPSLLSLVLNRQGRCYAKWGRYERAVSAYREQLEIGPSEVTSDGIPLGITALHQIANAYLKRGQSEDAAVAFLELYRGLLESRWPLSRSQFEFFAALAEGQIQVITEKVDSPSMSGIMGDIRECLLNKNERHSDTKTLERVQERIIPLMRLEAREFASSPEEFKHAAESTASGLLLVSFLSSEENSILGLLLEPGSIAREIFPRDSEKAGTNEVWTVEVVDETGTIVAIDPMGIRAETEKGADRQPAFSGSFTDSFPPWTINVYQRGANPAEKQFRLKRNITLLALGVVIAALSFGGILAIRSTAKELKLARLKSDFVATVSHEFRTPLTSIRYMGELLQRGRIPEEERKQEYYESITSESERLSRLVENLLDFSKIETGMKEYRMEEADIAALTEEVAERFRSQAGIKDFDLETQIAKNIPVIQADKESLSRAIFNLLDNAVKYSGDRPHIVLKTWFQEDKIFIQVEDNGIGIGKSEQKKIFEKFYRSEEALESSVKGSGIGLPLVDHIVRAHGGTVGVESELGKGTKMTLELPVTASEEKGGDKDG